MVKFLKLPFFEKLFTIEALLLLSIIKFIINFIPLKIYAPIIFGTHMKKGPKYSSEFLTEKKKVIKEIKRSVHRINNYMPWKKKCLALAATTKIMLKFKGIESTLYLGLIKKNKFPPYPHAKLKLGDEFITGGDESGYTILSYFS